MFVKQSQVWIDFRKHIDYMWSVDHFRRGKPDENAAINF